MSTNCRTYLPPEWAPQSGVMLTWPHRYHDWASQLKEIEQVYIVLTEHISRYERVLIACYDKTHRDHVEVLLESSSTDLQAISLITVPSDDTWVRDYGPITVICQDEAALLDFQFNGWGGKYSTNKDNGVSRTLLHKDGFGDTPMEYMPYVLEGGSIDVDGSGSLLTTRSCLMDSRRNANVECSALERDLKDWFGLTRIVWLDVGALAGDDTDGHIDTLARFCNADTIAYTSCDDPEDEHYASLSRMADQLRSLRAISDRPYKLVPLPLPAAIYNTAGQRLPATYANFLIINGAVLVPVYDDPADQTALQALSETFPDREVIAIDCLPLIQQYGSLHCITMQLPQGVLPTVTAS
ncbi:MAG: agmatine deiminase family protein [Gammaproteobacteria bacterium]|nr:MAG: agmatine deiminase family protein [Gammaproteobacteria bacterium]